MCVYIRILLYLKTAKKSWLEIETDHDLMTLYSAVLVNTASAQKGVSVEWYYEQDHFGEKYLLARIKFPPIETSQIQNNITALATWLEVGYVYMCIVPVLKIVAISVVTS